MEDYKSKEDWILSAFLCLSNDDKISLQDDIADFFNLHDDQSEKDKKFSNLYIRISEKLNIDYTIENPFKDRIYNYALLDATTNITYKNSIFPTKRQYVRNKENGHLIKPQWDNVSNRIVTEEIEADSAFVPPCTKDVFLKAYSLTSGSPMNWSREDMKAYREAMKELCYWFKNEFCQL